MLATFDRLTGIPFREQGPAFLIGLGHGATHWIAAFFYLLLPFITRDLGLSYLQAGLLVTVFHASSVAANFGSGAVVDITGRRALFQVVSLLVGAGALFAFGHGSTLWWLGCLVGLIGASNNLWHPAAISFLSARYPANRGYALSIHALGANLGDTVAPLAAGALLLGWTWQQTASLGAAPVVVVAAVIGFILLPNDWPVPGAPGSGQGFPEYIEGLLGIVRQRAVLGLCLMAGFRSMTQNGLYVFLPLYLVDVVVAGPFWTGVAMMALQLGGVVAAPVAGAWSDRVGRRRVVLAGLTVTTVIITALTMVSHEGLFVTGVALLGFALFAIRPVVHSWMLDSTPTHLSGSAMSLMFGTQAAFSAVVPIAGGFLADRYGLPSVFYLLAGTILVANVLVWLLPADARR